MLTFNEFARLLQIPTAIAILLGNRVPEKLCRFIVAYPRKVARVAVEADKEPLLGPRGRVAYSFRVAFICDRGPMNFHEFLLTLESDRKTTWDE